MAIKISLSRPEVLRKDVNEVIKCLSTSQLGLGPKLREFECKLSNYLGVKYALGVSSGTSALHLIIRSLGIKPGDEVITTPFSFIASANCILYEKAIPVFVDILPDTLTIDTEMVKKAITPRTRAILAVDVFGYPANWGELRKIASKHNLKLIEDSCEALGTEYNSKKCGTFGDIASFSFYPNKQITTGEGGAIVTNNKELYCLCKSMSNQGRDSKGMKWLEHIRLGYNYRLSDINASLGISQLSRIDKILEKRTQVAEKYSNKLQGIRGILLPFVGSDIKLSWFVYVIRLAEMYSSADRDRLIKKMFYKGIQCSNYFKSIHLQPFYRKAFKYKRGDFPVCEAVSDRTVALPFHNNLSVSDIRYIVDSLKVCLC